MQNEILGATVSHQIMDDENKPPLNLLEECSEESEKWRIWFPEKDDMAPSQQSLDNALDEKKYDDFIIAKVSGEMFFIKSDTYG